MKLLSLALTFAAFATRCAEATTIVGYKTDNNVTQHQRLDLDLKAMQMSLSLTPPDFAQAYKMYSKGTT